MQRKYWKMLGYITLAVLLIIFALIVYSITVTSPWAKGAEQTFEMTLESGSCNYRYTNQGGEEVFGSYLTTGVKQIVAVKVTEEVYIIGGVEYTFSGECAISPVAD